MIDPHYADGPVTLYAGDCIDVMRELPDNSVDSVVTDPPYGLSNTDPGHVIDTLTRWLAGDREYIPATGGGFMGKSWDAFVPPVAVWDEAFRALKPGGHLVCFAGTRTIDLMGLAIRLAGFEIRDSIAWMYGSGFPKSLDVSKAIDKAAGAEREPGVPRVYADGYSARMTAGSAGIPGAGAAGPGLTTVPATDQAAAWQGWGTALKPAFEPIVVARKPLTGTVAANVLQYGTGALNIDATRIGYQPDDPTLAWGDKFGGGKLNRNGEEYQTGSGVSGLSGIGQVTGTVNPAGRWPANVVLDEAMGAALDQQSGERPSGIAVTRNGGGRGIFTGIGDGRIPGVAVPDSGYSDSGGASRFFKVVTPDPPFLYTAKAPGHERPEVDGTQHATVKPLDLMRWLVEAQVTPPGGVILEPFAGSGTTVEAAVLEGFRCIAIEREATYLPLIEKRIRKPHHIGFDFGDWEMDA